MANKDDLRGMLSENEDNNFLVKDRKNFYFSNRHILTLNDSAFFGLQQVIAPGELFGVNENLHLRNYTQSTFGINARSMEAMLRENSSDEKISSLSEQYHIYQIAGAKNYTIFINNSNKVTLANSIYVDYFRSKGSVEYWQSEPGSRILVKHIDNKVVGTIMPCRCDFKEMKISS